MGHPLLRITHLSKTYSPGGGAPPVRVLEDINLDLQAGESAAIIGPSGSGKSTLLNIIGTLDQPTSGSVHLDGQSVSELNEKELAAVRNQKIGFIFQSHHLLPQCSVLENVLVPTLAGPSGQRAEKRTRAESLLGRVGLRDRLHHLPGQLSGGERQRVAVVRALINQPRLLLADEPTGALDQVSAGQLAELLVQLNAEQNVTLIVVTHAADLAKKMRRPLELANGRLLESSRSP